MANGSVDEHYVSISDRGDGGLRVVLDQQRTLFDFTPDDVAFIQAEAPELLERWLGHKLHRALVKRP